MKSKYYIYAHLNPVSNEIFYIGKGTGSRASSKTGRSKEWFDYIKESGGDYKILIVKDNLSEKEVIKLEKKLISKIKAVAEGGTLVNIEETGRLSQGGIIMVFYDETISSSYNENRRYNFKGLSDDEIISELLEFKNWDYGQSLENDFNKIYDEMFNNLTMLEEEDEDQYSELENALTEIYELISDVKNGFMQEDEFYEELEFYLEGINEIESSSEETPLLYEIKTKGQRFLNQTMKSRSSKPTT